jgi:hypothetical protein
MSEIEGITGNKTQTITDWNTTSFTVTGLESETAFYFTVRVEDYSGLISDSNQVQALTTIIPETLSLLVLLFLIIAISMVVFYQRKHC